MATTARVACYGSPVPVLITFEGNGTRMGTDYGEGVEQDLIVGNYTVTYSKSGYTSRSHGITVTQAMVDSGYIYDYSLIVLSSEQTNACGYAGYAKMVFRCQPYDATVVIDGVSGYDSGMGVERCLTAGNHSITWSKTGYKTTSFTATITLDMTTTMETYYDYAYLEAHCSAANCPSPAKTCVNDTCVDSEVCTSANCPPPSTCTGTYECTLPNPTCANVTFTVYPAETQLTLNGTWYPTDTVLCLPKGNYVAHYSLSGYTSKDDNITISQAMVDSGETYEYVTTIYQPTENACGELGANRVHAEFVIMVSPPGSTIRLNGEILTDNSQAAGTYICVQVGSNTLICEHAGYTPKTDTLTVTQAMAESIATYDHWVTLSQGSSCANVKFIVHPAETQLTLNGVSTPTNTVMCLPVGNYTAIYALSGYGSKTDHIAITQAMVDSGETYEYVTTIYAAGENACHETGTARVHAEIKFIITPTGSKITMNGEVLTTNSQLAGTYVCVPVGANTVKYEHSGYASKTDTVTVTPAMALTIQTYEHVVTLSAVSCSPVCNTPAQKCDTTKTPPSCICASPCPTGTTCVKNTCTDTTHPCSTQYPMGFCTTGTCKNGTCSSSTSTCDGLDRNGSFDIMCILEKGNEMYLYGAIGILALLALRKRK